MIQYRRSPEKKLIGGRQVIIYAYPPINSKVCRETAHTVNCTESRVKDIMKFWSKFLYNGMLEDRKVKIPYIGAFQPRGKYRELEPVLNDDDFEKIELK